MHELVKVEYQTFEVMFNEQGWFNATEAAVNFRKRVDHWLANQETKEYIAALADLRASGSIPNTRDSGDLIRTKRDLDAVLLGCEMGYDARKAKLERFAQDQRARTLPTLGEAIQ